MADTVKDPVCGMNVDPGTSVHENDKSFCSEECKNKYIVNPGRYVSR